MPPVDNAVLVRCYRDAAAHRSPTASLDAGIQYVYDLIDFWSAYRGYYLQILAGPFISLWERASHYLWLPQNETRLLVDPEAAICLVTLSVKFSPFSLSSCRSLVPLSGGQRGRSVALSERVSVCYTSSFISVSHPHCVAFFITAFFLFEPLNAISVGIVSNL